MADVAKLVKVGKDMGLEGAALQAFVADQQQLQKEQKEQEAQLQRE